MEIMLFRRLLKATQSKLQFSTTVRTSLLKNVTFFGNDLFSVAILNGLNSLVKKDLIQNLNVVTCDNTKQQHSGIKEVKKNHVINYCKENKLDFHIWQKIKDDCKYQELFNGYDLAFVASFGYLIPSKLISVYEKGIVNVHPSLLPRWRGASPLQYTILSDDKVTGVTLMNIMPKRFDVGPIIMQQSLKTPENVTTLKLLDLTANLSIEMLGKYVKNHEFYMKNAKPQPESGVTYAHKLTNEFFNIDWTNQSCQEIDCLYRALHESSHLKTDLKSKPVKLVDMQQLSNQTPNMDMSKPPGYVTFIPSEKTLAIKCKDGYVGFKRLILKSKLEAIDFHNGYLQGRPDVVFSSKNNPVLDNVWNKK